MTRAFIGSFPADLSGDLEETLVGIMVLAQHDPEAACSVARDAYKAFLKDYRPLLNILPAVAEEAADDVAAIFAGTLRLATSVQEDEGLKVEMKRFRLNQAKARFEKVQILEEVGFTREEAMSLLLADIAAMKTAAQSVSKSSNSNNKG